MISIVAIHMLQIHLPVPFMYNMETQKRVNHKYAMLDRGVDTFFVIGGLTLTYQFLSAREKG